MNRLLKPAVLSISLLIIISGSAVSPALAEIKAAFQYTDSTLIKMVVTLPSIILIPFSILSGRISAIISPRNIIISGIVIYIIGGLGSALSRNIYELLLFRGILGSGVGLLLPLSTSLIADFYVNDERTQMMGLSNAVANLGSIIATLVAGWLAMINWRYIFGVYSLAIIVLILTILGLPDSPQRKITTLKHQTINNKVIVLAFLGFFLNVAFYSVVTNISIFITDRNLGNSSDSGVAMSLLTLAGFLSGIILQKLSEILKNAKAPTALGIMSIGFILLSIGVNLWLVFISTFMIGFGLGVLKPVLLLKTAEVTPNYSNALALSIVNSSMFFGKFMSPFILNFLGNIFGNNTISFTFAMVGIFLAGAFLLSLQSILYRTTEKII